MYYAPTHNNLSVFHHTKNLGWMFLVLEERPYIVQHSFWKRGVFVVCACNPKIKWRPVLIVFDVIGGYLTQCIFSKADYACGAFWKFREKASLWWVFHFLKCIAFFSIFSHYIFVMYLVSIVENFKTSVHVWWSPITSSFTLHVIINVVWFFFLKRTFGHSFIL
jgi:hypothetical protein